MVHRPLLVTMKLPFEQPASDYEKERRANENSHNQDSSKNLK